MNTWEINFDDSSYGWYFMLIPIMLFILYTVYQWKKKVRAQFADTHLINLLIADGNFSQFWKKSIFGVLAIVLLIFALMDPLVGEELKNIKREGIDIVYVLDVSRSMDAEDLGVSRLTKAKNLVDNSMDKLGGDRVGLVVFAGNAYTLSPLTSDYAATKLFLQNIDTNLVSAQGTNTAAAIAQAVELLKGTVNTSKAIVLLSDGENHEENMNKAINYAKSNQVKIFSIGLGTKKGAPIPLKDFGENGYKKDAEGQTVITKLENTELKEMANATQGQYQTATTTEATLQELHNNLSRLERKESKEAVMKDMKHNFQLLIGLALLFFLSIEFSFFWRMKKQY